MQVATSSSSLVYIIRTAFWYLFICLNHTACRYVVDLMKIAGPGLLTWLLSRLSRKERSLRRNLWLLELELGMERVVVVLIGRLGNHPWRRVRRQGQRRGR